MAAPRTVLRVTAALVLPAAAALALPLALSGCESEPLVPATADNTHMFDSSPELDRDAAQAAGAEQVRVTHGAVARAHTQELNERLAEILKSTLPVVDKLLADLDTVVARLKPPERLATSDPVLHTWGKAERDSYKSTIDLVYDEAERRLQSLNDVAMAEARSQAQALATPRAPLDAGATGDPALDTALSTFAEVIDGAIGLKNLALRHQTDKSHQVELFEVFTSFGSRTADKTEDAEKAMHGRLLLFVGGDETKGEPRAMLAFRSDDGKPAEHHFLQVERHRVMRGTTVVADLGWRAAPVPPPGMAGHPQTDVLEHYLLAPRAQPVVNRDSPNYDKLRDMRIVVDIQSAVVGADGALLGGVDWRIEFVVSARGDLTWQLAGGQPVFDSYCTEIKAVLGM